MTTQRDDRRPPGGALLIGGVIVFFAVCTLAAAIFAGAGEAIATLLVGLVVLVGAVLWSGRVRSTTRGWRDPARGTRDPVPGVGADGQRPLGDTPEAHDEITPRDLPAGHPGRAAAERQAGELGGTTSGHREGGAAGGRGGTQDLVDADEPRTGARVRPERDGS
jgi:hypothetical protein